MRFLFALFFGWYLFSESLYGQSTVIHGVVLDAASLEPLVSANIVAYPGAYGTVTDADGRFRLSLQPGAAHLEISYVGYAAVRLKADSLAGLSSSLRIVLSPKAFEQIIEISATRLPGPPKTTLSVEQIRLIPALGGERDLVKAFQFTPGVATATEGSAVLIVRGSAPDQSLILLDGMPVYNMNHLWGFLSMVNPETVKSATLYKGGFPARFGGRSAAVMDIQSREGNLQRWQGAAGIGLISSRLQLEGPLLKEKCSVMLAGRSSYIGLAAPLLSGGGKKRQSGTYNNLWLYDYSGRINYKINPRSQLTLSTYAGRDWALFQDEGTEFSTKERNLYYDEVKWGNRSSSLRYNYIGDKGNGFQVIAGRTDYFYDYAFHESNYNSLTDSLLNTADRNSRSNIAEWSGRMEYIQPIKGGHSLTLGMEWYHRKFENAFSRSFLERGSPDVRQSAGYPNEMLGGAVFLEDSWTLNARFALQAGLRWSGAQAGHTTYHLPEPRVNLTYQLDENTFLRTGYSRMGQYLHLLTGSATALPNDVWVPVTDSVGPQQADHLYIGGGKNLGDWRLETDVYFRNVSGMIDYAFGTSYEQAFTENWENLVAVNGKGRAYGWELSAVKSRGKWTGMFSYSLGWSRLQFASINNGEWYPYRYDRRHLFAATFAYVYSPRITVSGNWLLQSGHAITLPVGAAENFWVFDKRNNSRMPAYHRLDLGLDYLLKENEKWRQELNFSLFNAYNRKNPFAYSIESIAVGSLTGEGFTTKRRLKKRGLFPILPGISYQIKLK